MSCFMLSATLFAQQQITVKGNVKDEAGEPIIGASIKSGTTGTISDLDGNFTLNVSSDATLEVTYLGYVTQSIKVANRTILPIVMNEDTQKLEEVVIVGYGTQRVKDLTGAATPVHFDDVEQLPGASIADALSGQIVGVSVSQSTGRPGAYAEKITIRQPAPTFGTGADFPDYGPLIVIDDVVQVNDLGEPDMTAFNMLDYSEIESMTILKDASAAVYGSRASQGVILVKTKKGTIGTPKISYSAKLDFADAVSHSKTMNAYETGIFTNRLVRQTNAINKDNKYDYALYSDSELNTMKSLNYDWLDKAWSSSFSHRHSLSVNGGSEKVTYFAGITYQDQDSNLGNVQDFKKWTFRTGGEIKVAAGLKLSASIAGYNSKTTKPNHQVKIAAGPWGSQSNNIGDYPQLHHMPGYIPMEVTTDEGTFWTSPWAGSHYAYPYRNDDSVSGFSLWNYFANENSKARINDEDNGYNANFSLTYDVPFIKGLSLKGTYAVSYGNTYSNEIGDYYQLALATNTNEAGMHLLGDYTTWVYPQFGRKSDVNQGPTVRFNKKTIKSEQMNFMINYNRTFGDHDIAVTGVVERAESEGKEHQSTYKSPLESFNGSSAFAGTLQTGSGDTYLKKNESGALSYIGRLNYKYANRYLFQFIIRSDASTKFAPENYWGTFPTGSVGWVASEEKFFQNSKISKFIDYLKIRYSLGKTGKDNVKAWTWLSAFNTNSQNGLSFGQTTGGSPTLGAMYNGTANRNIKWDQTIKHNIGVDLNVLDNRLGLTVDYFHDKTTDLLMLVPRNPETVYIGQAFPVKNYGIIKAQGWEFSLSWKDQIKQTLLPKLGPIRYGVVMTYDIKSYKVTRGQPTQFNYPSYVNDQSSWTGYNSANAHEWGFKVWKGTSGGDGILRTQSDIDNYWAYLEQNAIASGGKAEDARYFTKSKDEMYVGMLAYQDLGGDMDTENKTIGGANGRIDRDEDYAKLANKRSHSINTKLNFNWGNFSLTTQIATSFGGYSSFYVNQTPSISKNDFIWSQFSYVKDMFDPTDNPNGKYPSMAVDNAWSENSDFWKVSSFRCFVRFMTIGYTLPKSITQKAGIDKLQFNLTGNNLWDFYNPYPDKFRNMYDKSQTLYPTLRTWTLGVNLTF